MESQGTRVGVVGFLGLDELSLEMAATLLRSGYKVQAFEVDGSLIGEFVNLGGIRCASATETVKGVATVIVQASEACQIDVVFGQHGFLKDLQRGAVIILRSTIPLCFIQNLEKSLNENGLMAYLVDAYVSRGKSELLNGKIMITSSGSFEAIAKARPILSAMCQKLYLFEGEVGAGSKAKMVDDLLLGIHFVTSVEAVSLGAQVGIHPWMVYDIISNAAGNSWAFKNHVPPLLRGMAKSQSLHTLVQDMGTVLDRAKSLTFPLLLAAVAHQQLIAASSYDLGDENEGTLIKLWEKLLGVHIREAASAELYSPEQLAHQITANSISVKRVGFIGLGAMGFGMATQLLKSQFCVLGYDAYKPTLSRFASAGGLIGNSPAEICKDVDVLVIMVANEAQAESILYGDHGAVPALPSGASIILSSTVSPAFVSQLDRKLQTLVSLKLLQ